MWYTRAASPPSTSGSLQVRASNASAAGGGPPIACRLPALRCVQMSWVLFKNLKDGCSARQGPVLAIVATFIEREFDARSRHTQSSSHIPARRNGSSPVHRPSQSLLLSRSAAWPAAYAMARLAASGNVCSQGRKRQACNAAQPDTCWARNSKLHKTLSLSSCARAPWRTSSSSA